MKDHNKTEISFCLQNEGQARPVGHLLSVVRSVGFIWNVQVLRWSVTPPHQLDRSRSQWECNYRCKCTESSSSSWFAFLLRNSEPHLVFLVSVGEDEILMCVSRVKVYCPGSPSAYRSGVFRMGSEMMTNAVRAAFRPSKGLDQTPTGLRWGVAWCHLLLRVWLHN